MFNSKSKRAGLFGTLFFHIAIFLICFFSSIGFTSVEIPMGIEIEFVPYHDLNSRPDIKEDLHNSNSENIKVDNNQVVEKIILEQEETIFIPNDQDTLTLAKVDDANNESISLKLENALSKLNGNYPDNNSEVSLEKDTNLETSINENSTIIENIQDGYKLSDNRFAVRKIKPNYSCDEFGKIVVRVWVNREGVTIKAESGIRGTTESSPCLLKEAKNAALQTTWTPYFNAPEIQIGQITYNFHKY